MQLGTICRFPKPHFKVLFPDVFSKRFFRNTVPLRTCAIHTTKESSFLSPMVERKKTLIRLQMTFTPYTQVLLKYHQQMLIFFTPTKQSDG